MLLEVSVLSQAGGRTVNEDAYGVWSHQESGACFCVLSDGAGGHGGGDVASRLVVEGALGWFRQHPQCTEQALREAAAAANDAVLAGQAGGGSVADMRATVVILIIDVQNATALWGHVGDTRLYHFRDGSVLQQTRDHSVVQSMVDAGYLEASAVRTNPRRSALIVALGESAACAQLVVGSGTGLTAADLFLVCTDGLWEHVCEAEMEQLLTQSASSEALIRGLEAKVLAVAEGQFDNYSALALACQSS